MHRKWDERSGVRGEGKKLLSLQQWFAYCLAQNGVWLSQIHRDYGKSDLVTRWLVDPIRNKWKNNDWYQAVHIKPWWLIFNIHLAFLQYDLECSEINEADIFSSHTWTGRRW